jgi:peptide/nickel transport system substrate-binding protein
MSRILEGIDAQSIHRTQRLLKLSSLFAVTISLASLGCASESARANGGGTVIISAADAASLFPLTVQDETGRMVTDLLFDHLADLGDKLNTIGDGGFTPRLAKSWEWARDSMSITYHIDPAARFHDGVPVRASDVRYSLSLINDSTIQSAAAPVVANIDSVHVADSATAVIYFKRHLPEEFYDVAYQVSIVPEHVYGKVKPADMRTSDVLRHPIGSGRFRFVDWQPADRIELIADTANYKGRAKLDRVVVLLGQAPEPSATAVLAGESDVDAAFPLDEVARLDSSNAARAIPNPKLAYGFFGMRQHDRKSKTKPHPIFSEAAVRRAISMAIDRQSMLTNVFNGNGTLPHGPFPSSAATADAGIRVPRYDTTAAKALLDSAGWKTGANGVRSKNGRPLKFEIMLPSSSAIRVRYADLIQESLRRVGIQAELAKLSFPAFLARQDQGDFDAGMFTISVDPSFGGTKQNWTTEGEKAGTNWTGYVNPRVDALLDSAGRSTDPAAVKRYATRVYRTIVDDEPAVWLFDGFSVTAVNRRIEVAPYRADGWWTHLADWLIPADKRIDRDRIGLSTKTR